MKSKPISNTTSTQKFRVFIFYSRLSLQQSSIVSQRNCDFQVGRIVGTLGHPQLETEPTFTKGNRFYKLS